MSTILGLRWRLMHDAPWPGLTTGQVVTIACVVVALVAMRLSAWKR